MLFPGTLLHISTYAKRKLNAERAIQMVDVYLSPSVQQWNIGWGNYGTEEMRMNLVADVVEAELIRHGLSVARNDPSQSLTEVVAESNQINPTIHVAIHSNASASGAARGPEVYVHRLGRASEQLARDIYNRLIAISPADGLGIKEGYSAFGGQGYYELRRTKGPAVLVEVAFHDNPEDAQFIIDNIYEIGVAIAQGILEYFNIPYQCDTPENIAAMKAKYNGR